MRSAIFRQYDARWGKLPYPTKSYSFANNGCGCCACTHLVIELERYKNITPRTLRKYMVDRGFATRGNGTTSVSYTHLDVYKRQDYMHVYPKMTEMLIRKATALPTSYRC